MNNFVNARFYAGIILIEKRNVSTCCFKEDRNVNIGHDDKNVRICTSGLQQTHIFLYANRYAKTSLIEKGQTRERRRTFSLARHISSKLCAISNSSQILRHHIVSLLNETILVPQFYQFYQEDTLP